MPYSIYNLQNQIAKAAHTYGVGVHLKNIISSTNYKLIFYTISHFFFNILVFTFDIALVHRITNSFWSIAVYHYFIYIVVLLIYIFFYFLKTKIKVHKLFRLSIAFTFLTFIYLMIFFSSFHSLDLLYGYFFLRSIATALFFLGFHTSFLYGLTDDLRDDFSLLLYSVYTFLPVFLPILGGYIIDYLGFSFLPTNPLLPNGYFILYLISTAFSILFLLFSPKLDVYLDTTVGVKKAFNLLFNKDFADIRNYQIYDSFSMSIRVVVYGLLAFLILTNEFNLGSFESLIALFASIYFLFIRKLEKKKNIKRIHLFIIGVLADILSQIVFVIYLNFYGLLIRSISNTIVGPLKRIGGENILRKKYDEYSKKYNLNKSNFILLHEFSYTIGRTLATILIAVVVFVFNLTDVFTIFRYLIFVFLILDVLEYFVIKRINGV